VCVCTRVHVCVRVRERVCIRVYMCHVYAGIRVVYKIEYPTWNHNDLVKLLIMLKITISAYKYKLWL